MRCGPASLAAVLSFYGFKAEPDEISARVMESESSGAYHQNLYLYAASRGMSVQMYSGGIRDAKKMIARDRPVIILLDVGLRGGKYGHYVVVVGYDEENLYLYDGTEKDRKVSRRLVFGIWQRTEFFTMLILPPGTPLPATSGELVNQGLDSERAGDWAGAERLYRLALERDEINVAAIIGVGNARLHRGDPEGAIAWYRVALRNDRNREDARINMAAAYLKLGKTGTAKKLIQQACKGGFQARPDMRPYAMDTLGDILAAEGKNEEALRAYREALENQPTDDDSFVTEVKRKIEALQNP